ncbi:hypothetical protein LWI28_015360 [Acer negundo]|uniref:Methyltransferase type 11 domain-containing protein n=1 Tax=Acer negundo TaxID=4023 RepID=A0AAD5NS62_ACENE|nr:hypothetical protein LWI28_015360 [Acer negundo]KAK4846527.1 hypothetical protein QYF36_018609 [Acer negundo]
MEKHIESLLKRISWGSITIATLTLMSMIIQTPETCIPETPNTSMTKFPRSSCDSNHRRHLPIDKKNHRLWTSKAWNQQVQSYVQLFGELQNRRLLANHSKVLCVSAGAGHEVMALNRIGVSDVTGVEVIDSLPLVSRADPHNLPFFDGIFDLAFTAHLAEALFPLRFVEEMERTVRNGGSCVVVVERCGGEELDQIVGLFRKSRLVNTVNVTFNGAQMTRILMRRKVSA